MESLIRVEALGYRYNHRWVLEKVSFELHRGEMVGLIGPNGSGKTTLLKCLIKILEPRTGQVYWEGRPLSTYSRNQIARNLAWVGQETPLWFYPTVLETVLMGRNPYLKRFQLEGPEDLLAAERAMEMTDVAHLKDRSLAQLSSGERQRVYLARALCQQPQVLLLDEPTSFLDIQHQVGIMALISRLNREEGMAVLVASHDINLMSQYCGKMILIRKGRLITIGSPEQVIRAELIERVFETRVWVDENPINKAPRIVPLGPRDKPLAERR